MDTDEQGTETGQTARLRVDALPARLDRDRAAATDADIEVQSVLGRLALRYHLEPDPRPPPGGIDDAVRASAQLILGHPDVPPVRIPAGEAIRERPEEEPLADALAQLFVAEYTANRPDEALRAAVRRAASNPGMSGALERAMLATEAPLAEAIADRTGTDASCDLYPNLAAAAAVSALRATIAFWLSASGTPPSLRDMLGRAIAETVPPASSHPYLKETQDGV
jgi:hypothetical protein